MIAYTFSQLMLLFTIQITAHLHICTAPSFSLPRTPTHKDRNVNCFPTLLALNGAFTK